MEKYGIEQKVLDEICEIAEKYSVEKVILFGSRARGDFKRTSDIVDLEWEIQPELLKSIEKEGVILYEKI